MTKEMSMKRIVDPKFVEEFWKLCKNTPVNAYDFTRKLAISPFGGEYTYNEGYVIVLEGTPNRFTVVWECGKRGVRPYMFVRWSHNSNFSACYTYASRIQEKKIECVGNFLYRHEL